MSALGKASIDTRETAMKESIYFVEADPYSRHKLYEETVKEGLTWVDFGVSWNCLAGKIEGTELEVWVNVSFAHINGKMVCFYSAPGRYADWTMIDNFLKPYFKKNIYGMKQAGDSLNFHQCVATILESCKKP